MEPQLAAWPRAQALAAFKHQRRLQGVLSMHQPLPHALLRIGGTSRARRRSRAPSRRRHKC
jgi:hypothetical protein